MQTSSILIEQALHGYVDGHQLIATSADLTREQSDQLLVMSDLSGTSFRDGFDGYLSAYPFTKGGRYCIAKTWFAPEMPRPGCVWTHSLIIRDEDLAGIKNFSSLLRLFVRPEVNDAYSYESSLQFWDEAEPESRPFKIVRRLLWSLYGANRRVIVASNSSGYEADIFAVFEQAWPRLRRSLSFCTGALSLRDSEFLISVSPSELTHNVKPTSVVIGGVEGDHGPSDEWLKLVETDLRDGIAGSPLRKFLWQYGGDHRDAKAAFRPLAEIFCLLGHDADQPQAEQVLSAISYFFQSPNDAARLKRDLFGLDGVYSNRLGGEEAILKVLVSHPAAASILPETANVRGRAELFVSANPNVATQIAMLASELGGQNGDQFLDAYLGAMNWSQLDTASLPSNFVSVLLEKNPAVFGNSSLWTKAQGASIVFKAASQIERHQVSLFLVVAAMFEAKAWDALTILAERVGTQVHTALFEVVEQSNKSLNYSDALFALLTSNPHVIRNLGNFKGIGSRSLLMFSTELDPRSYYVRNVDISRWADACSSKYKISNSSRALRSAIFFLTLGLQTRGEEGARMVALSLFTVYAAASRGEIEKGLWERLEPSLAWYRDSGDKCARLAKTAARGFKDKEWSPEEFGQAFPTEEMFERALMELSDSYAGRRFLGLAKHAALSGTAQFNDVQLQMLRKARSQ